MAYHRDPDRATRGVGAVDAVDRFKSPARRAREIAARRRSAARDLVRAGRGMQGSLGRMKEDGVPDDEIGGGSGGGGFRPRHPLRTPPKPGQIISPVAKHPGVRAPITAVSPGGGVMVFPKAPVRVVPLRDTGFTTSPPRILTYPAPPPASVTGVHTVAGGPTGAGGGAWVVPVTPIPPTPPYDDEGGDLASPMAPAPSGSTLSKPVLIGAAALALYLLFGRG